MARRLIRYFSIAPGSEYTLGMTEDGRYVFAGNIGGTQMTELYDIGRERYEKFTDPANKGKIHDMIQDVHTECQRIAFQGSRAEPMPVMIPEHRTLEEHMEYFRFISENHVTGGRVEDERLILVTDDCERCFDLD
ncbi:MAG: hypothetical protein J6Z29_02265 [Ruminococcus sp.]|uniref:Uncharacterized protein n=1 Tax=Ruminococcus albus TaxID=1264 RepID=A0A1H7HZM0_RUMAL|nr:hypothetical protein [Ruminococcus albus]MBP5267395.1 hypothetical protein [Ruminococcus sp.]SEK53685.1 hypothetical protein SAMN05216469_10392 [Ruminococcus albus]